MRRIWSRPRACEYVIGFALLPASRSGHATSLATVYRQVATGPREFSGLRIRIGLGLPTVFLHDAIFVSWEIFLCREFRIKFRRRNAGRSSKEHRLRKCYYSFRPGRDASLPATSPDELFPRRLYGVFLQLVEENFHQDLGLQCHF